jgi:hypothetical protein
MRACDPAFHTRFDGQEHDMADKELTPAQKRAATIAKKKAEKEAAAVAEADRKETERKRLMGAGAVLVAIALFAGGYALGESSDDGDLIGSDIAIGERGFFDDDTPTPRGDRPTGPRGGFPFPEGFELPDNFAFHEGCEFPDRLPGPFGDDGPRGPGGGFDFDLPEEFPFGDGEGFGFSLECVDGECTFQLPEGFDFSEDFDFPAPGSPFGEDEPDDDQAPFGEPGFLGVSVSDGPNGVLVNGLDPGSPADEAGIEPGDVFVSVDGASIETVEDLVDAIADAGAGTEVEVTIDRGGDEVSFDVVLTGRPA